MMVPNIDLEETDVQAAVVGLIWTLREDKDNSRQRIKLKSVKGKKLAG